ncbi:RNA polymerase sigma factor [Bacillus pinisoli]|uniref:RNA polymerase sigma factor n=1 Tax=Bacillus pinisoli TaxID=2901866 RepID=UPI001FF17811|nr:RNA polymerase sigma factor [Bacillus pinisoli]
MDIIQKVKEAKQGDKEALLQLVMAQKDEYYRLAYSYMGSKHDALDVLEEMIVIVYEKVHQLKKPESFYSWSKTILVNRCKDLVKKQKKVVLIKEWRDQMEESNANQQSIPDPYQSKEQEIDIHALLESINIDQAEAIKLKYFHDLDYKSISKMTNVSVGTVKSRIFHGLRKMKHLYGGDLREKS